MIKLTILFVLSILIIGTLSTTTNYLYTVCNDQEKNSNSIQVINPFASTPSQSIVKYLSLWDYRSQIADILSFNVADQTMLMLGSDGLDQQLVYADYSSSAKTKVIGEVILTNSFQYYPQKRVFIDNVVYLPVQILQNGLSNNINLLVSDFNDETSRLFVLNSPSFISGNGKKFIEGYDPINNKLYIGYSTTTNSNSLIEVTLNLHFNGSGSDSGSASPYSQVLYENINGLSNFEYIFTDNSGQIYIVSTNSNLNYFICKFDTTTKECPIVYYFNKNMDYYSLYKFFLSQDRNTFTLMCQPNSGNTESLQLEQFQVNNNMNYTVSPTFPNFWNTTKNLLMAISN